MKLYNRLAMITCLSIMSTLPPCPESDLHSAIQQMEALTGQKKHNQAQSETKPCNPCGTYSATVLPEDRFTGEKKIITSLAERVKDSDSHMRPIAMWSSVKPREVAILFTGSHRDWRYLKCDSVGVLIDDRRVELKSYQHDGKVLNQTLGSSVMETMITVIDREKLEGILGEDSKIEYKICNDEFKADSQFVCELRSLLDKTGTN